ncbi:UNVERIFIED_CONTAM: hypothetical protein FKN15_066822 [Acipenser sinensis]
MISGKAKALPGKEVGKTPMKQSAQAKKPVPGQQANTKNNSGQKAVSKSASKITTEKKGAEKGVKAASTAGIKKEVSCEEKAALSIRCAFRKHLTRKELAKRRKEKVEYEELMDCLEKEAFVAMVRREQEEVERERQKEEDERKKRREEDKQRKRILEAAFEGDVAEILAVLKEARDNGRRLATGGHTDEVGEQELAFPSEDVEIDGTSPAVKLSLSAELLPLIKRATGILKVASLDSVVRTLQDWDLKTTESMLQKMEAERQRRAAEEQKQKVVEADWLRDEVQQLIKEHERCQKEAIHDAEDVVEKAKVAAQHAEEQLSLSRLELREQSGGADWTEQLNFTLWPLLIDPSGQASTFLRYRDTNYTDALNPEHMKPEVLRLALLGAIRFGKPLVFNMMEVNLFESVENQFDQIQAGLMEQLLTKQLLQNERYLSLVRPSDDPQYSKTEFRSSRSEKLKLLFVTKLRNPPESLLTALCPIEVTIPQPK